jgi:hypothetical protein
MSAPSPAAGNYGYAPSYRLQDGGPSTPHHGAWIVAIVVAVAISALVGFTVGRIYPVTSSTPSGGGHTGPTGCPDCSGYVTDCPLTGGAPVGSAPEIASHTGTVAPGPSVQTAGIPVVPQSLLLVFVGYVNPSIGGGEVASITDSAQDSFTELNSTGDLQNHSEDAYWTTSSGGSSLQVTVSFEDQGATIGGSVAVLDITGSGSPTFIGLGQGSGPGPEVVATMGPCDPNDLFVLGVSGQAHILPFESVQGAQLLDSGSADAGPWTDGVVFGTFDETSNGSAENFQMTCGNEASVWESIALLINPA